MANSKEAVQLVRLGRDAENLRELSNYLSTQGEHVSKFCNSVRFTCNGRSDVSTWEIPRTHSNDRYPLSDLEDEDAKAAIKSAYEAAFAVIQAGAEKAAKIVEAKFAAVTVSGLPAVPEEEGGPK